MLRPLALGQGAAPTRRARDRCSLVERLLRRRHRGSSTPPAEPCAAMRPRRLARAPLQPSRPPPPQPRSRPECRGACGLRGEPHPRRAADATPLLGVDGIRVRRRSRSPAARFTSHECRARGPVGRSGRSRCGPPGRSCRGCGSRAAGSARARAARRRSRRRGRPQLDVGSSPRRSSYGACEREPVLLARAVLAHRRRMRRRDVADVATRSRSADGARRAARMIRSRVTFATIEAAAIAALFVSPSTTALCGGAAGRAGSRRRGMLRRAAQVAQHRAEPPQVRAVEALAVDRRRRDHPHGDLRRRRSTAWRAAPGSPARPASSR